MIGNSMSNNLIVGLTSNDESRGALDKLFPFVDILEGGTSYTSFGTEPFTVEQRAAVQDVPAPGQLHEVRHQAHDDLRRNDAAIRVGERVLELLPAEQLHLQLAGRLLHRRQRLPARIRTGRRRRSRCGAFKVRYSNVPGLEKPVQPLEVWYSGAYAQDEWRPRRDLTVTAGIRMDVRCSRTRPIRTPRPTR